MIGMAIITNSMEGKILAMTVTVHRTCACVLGISGETQGSHHVYLLFIYIHTENVTGVYGRIDKFVV